MKKHTLRDCAKKEQAYSVPGVYKFDLLMSTEFFRG